MMRNPKLSYKDVVSAILSVKAEGQKVTVDALLAKLGRGSKTTIHQHMRAWLDEQPMPNVEPKRLSDGVLRVIAKEIEEVERRAVESLKIELVEAQRNSDALAVEGASAEDRANALEGELLEEQQRNAKLTAILEEKQSALEKLEFSKQDLRATIDRLNVDLAKAELKLEGYQELKIEIKELYVKLQAALVEAAELRGRSQL
jgi:hypothetical protein